MVKKMITYEKAYKIAKGLKSLINYSVEYDTAYLFGYDDGTDTIFYGGTEAPCVVLKKDGSAVSMPWFIAKEGGGKYIRDLEIDDKGNIIRQYIEEDEECEKDFTDNFI